MNVSFKALVGSHNYNLATDKSDLDYKVFYYPTFDDLYKGDKTSKSNVTNELDVEYHDIRKLPEMLWKSNVNFIETLFTQEIESNDGLFGELDQMRESIARMNLPYLWDACVGMMFQKLKDAQRDMSYVEFPLDEKANNRKIGKSLHQISRIHMFLSDYANNDFTSFADAIYIKDGGSRNHLLEVKEGKVNLQEKFNYCKQKMSSDSLEQLKQKYKSQHKNEETRNKVEEIVKWYVTKEIVNDLCKENNIN